MSIRTFQTISFRVGWLLLTLGAFFLLYNVTLENPYFTFATDIGFLLAKQDFIHHTIWMTAFYLHIGGCIFCLIIGPFQFIHYLRKKFPNWHRNLGKIYIISIVAVGGPSGLYMAWFANGGFWAQAGFTVLAVLWMFSTYWAYRKIIKKDFEAHRRWMVRSYALTFSAVTLRTWMPILSLYWHIDHDTAVIVTAWINWIPNVLIAEALVRFFPKKF
jgi:uncharacterized membrane protein